MHYVKHFTMHGIDSRQVACIELHGAPNAATEGAVGVLGIDMDSPRHEVYKCVAVNGSIYSWELCSDGLSFIAASVSVEGATRAEFLYEDLLIPSTYRPKLGDSILDTNGCFYAITSIGVDRCFATHSGLQVKSVQIAQERGNRVDMAISQATFSQELDSIEQDMEDEFETVRNESSQAFNQMGQDMENEFETLRNEVDQRFNEVEQDAREIRQEYVLKSKLTSRVTITQGSASFDTLEELPLQQLGIYYIAFKTTDGQDAYSGVLVKQTATNCYFELGGVYGQITTYNISDQPEHLITIRLYNRDGTMLYENGTLDFYFIQQL